MIFIHPRNNLRFMSEMYRNGYIKPFFDYLSKVIFNAALHLYYAIALRLVNKKSSSFRHLYDLLCPKNVFVFVSVFAKLLMPVCGVRKFVSVLYSVFVRQ
jgi:hypothetical protein